MCFKKYMYDKRYNSQLNEISQGGCSRRIVMGGTAEQLVEFLPLTARGPGSVLTSLALPGASPYLSGVGCSSYEI